MCDMYNRGLGCPSHCHLSKCFGVVGSLTCLCDEDRYGDDCEYGRFQHICSHEGKMVINANIEGATSYFVKDTGCQLTGSGGEIPSEWEGPSRVINTPSDTDCGEAVVTDNGDGTSRTCITAYVVFQTGYLTNRDIMAKFCCTGEVLGDVTVNTITIDSSSIGVDIQSASADEVFDLDVKLYDESGIEIPSSRDVEIGQEVEVRFRLSADADFVGLKPIDCTLQDHETRAVFIINLISSGCATSDLNSALTYDAANYNYDLNLEMIKFLSSDSAFLVCDIRVCVVGANCDATDCSVSRRKRDTSSNTTEAMQQVVTEIKVKDPFTRNGVEREADVEVTRATTINLSAAVIGLGIVVLILLAVCLILGLCLINKRRSPDPKLQDGSRR